MPHPFLTMTTLKRILTRLWLGLRLLLLAALIAVLIPRSNEDTRSIQARVLASVRGQTFNYVEWEVNAIWNKLRQELFGYHAFLPEANRTQLVLDYFAAQRRVWEIESQLIQLPTDDPQRAALQTEHDTLSRQLERDQALVQHIIEGQVSVILNEQGFGILGQPLPPVSMQFLEIPDVLVISPRDAIRQEMTVTLQPMEPEARTALENQVVAAVPDVAAWVTPIGGVGVYPAMVRETDRAVIAFEITAHEWAHHYLVFFPLGLEYFSSPDTRLINETTATIFGDEVGNLVIERFYRDYLASGQVYLQAIPDYRALLAQVVGNVQAFYADDSAASSPLMRPAEGSRTVADVLLSSGHPEAAQLWLDVRANQNRLLGYQPPTDPNQPRPDSDAAGWISHTRLMADYLLLLGDVPAAELAMENGRQHTGLRVLNQAWFAFNVGYQANPVLVQQPDGTASLVTSGGGGDPLGAAIYEIRARAGSLQAFLQIMRGITTRENVFAALDELRDN